ncbi:sensor histidine kinase [Butyrivibrio sp. YAB3001]|uniref:sensor histidine kinase n=1 Tax=Butyrivibrio sp. YAB3001 TaxID=1520812 RepID=UPI0008F61CF1|nr:HAMP domain-containing sensor histidine kinase [Butyrivibrio sp. YAB3001]SFB84479.1 His Kinase A (phospho-acceptor) domain-containing protein [Butyrivibrio sp. YAB3001]
MQDKKRFEEPGVDSRTVEELSKKLLEANAKLQKAENERKIMLENISHDLRAPLTAIRSTVDYIKLKNDDKSFNFTGDEFQDMLKLLDNRTKTLEVLVQDLYYLTCIDSGKDKLKLCEVPLEQFLEEYFFAAEMDDKYKKKRLILEIPDDYSRMVKLDTDKMTRVLDNLFTNAYKYSDDGAEIALGVKETSDKACFYVRDTGYGIKQEEVELIFDRTYTASSARTPSKEPSSGLGLTIVESIVTQHGGRVWCESKYGEGSTFFVEI